MKAFKASVNKQRFTVIKRRMQVNFEQGAKGELRPTMNNFLFLLSTTKSRGGVIVLYALFSKKKLSDEKRIHPLCRFNFSDHGIDRGDQWIRSLVGKISPLVSRGHHSPNYIFQKFDLICNIKLLFDRLVI